jgi:hypothetical protein
MRHVMRSAELVAREVFAALETSSTGSVGRNA